ncbi:hypothetical protein FO519_008758 [Halicephalobus sp. NKZ332]|nr:hypothetical protein FO519_008758 [Halicephalobus sp. NKZ332]
MKQLMIILLIKQSKISQVHGSGLVYITYSNWAPREPANQTEANGCVSVDMKGLWYNDNCSTSYSFISPFMAASDKATYYYPIAQSINDLSNAVIALRIFGDDPPAFNDSLQSILNLGIFNYNDGVPINAVVFTTRDLYAVEVHDVQVLVNQFTVIGGTVTVVLIYSTKNDTTYYEMVNGLNVVLWSNNSIMLSSIRQGFKCEGGTPVFKPCKSWISFALDSSNVLSPTDFQNQLNFVSNAISKMNHAEHVQLVSMNGSIANWYDPYPISYIQSQMNSTTQNGNFSLNASLNAIYSSYIQLTTLPKPPIGALVFVSDTSSPSNYEGADDVVNHLKNNGFKLTFILMGLNVNQTLLKKYTDNFITWTDLSNPQPDNWDNVYLDAYACPK